jgi:hypothetical protein
LGPDPDNRDGMTLIKNPVLYEAKQGSPELDEPTDCCTRLIYRKWFLPATRVIIVLITLALYGILAFMFYRADYTQRYIKPTHKLIHEFNFYLPIYVIIL